MLSGFSALSGGCAATTANSKARTFGEDAAFLKMHADAIVLASPDGNARIAVAPKYQGRVMTSTLGGDAGVSYGYLNDELIKSGKPVPKISVWGGEDRFWLGPEGGQFAIFIGHQNRGAQPWLRLHPLGKLPIIERAGQRGAILQVEHPTGAIERREDAIFQIPLIQQLFTQKRQITARR